MILYLSKKNNILKDCHRQTPRCSMARHSRKDATAVDAKAQEAPQLPPDHPHGGLVSKENHISK